MTTSTQYTQLPGKASLKPTRFDVSSVVSDEQIQKFKQLIQLSELGPRTFENTTQAGDWGVSYDWLAGAKKRWETGYDWRQTEQKINSYPNYKVDVTCDDGETYDVHFIALFSDKKDATPIVFLHGWPGSFLEFLGLLDVIKSKYTSASLPYHIVVPSLPGYGYSGSPSLKKDMTMGTIAQVTDKLMAGLGFEDGYVAQGGDVGSFVSHILVASFPRCKAAHLNMVSINEDTSDIPDSAINDFEREGLKRRQEFGITGNAYLREQGTKTATIAFVLSSSPLALLAWIGEKFLSWSDVDPPLDDILDSVSLYWFTQTLPRCIYPYRGLMKRQPGSKDPKIVAPKAFGYSFFPQEIIPTPKAWVEKLGNLVWFKQHTSGGHFAALEKPKELFGDVEDFVKQVWKSDSKI